MLGNGHRIGGAQAECRGQRITRLTGAVEKTDQRRGLDHGVEFSLCEIIRIEIEVVIGEAVAALLAVIDLEASLLQIGIA
ncbi:hypothetical protein GCM10023342_12180 [Modicisalibacter zincidurans]|uniref:Uncharacterized protein n=1 Tax=Modicisalibacter zincidurans TaxID=1178777 RepID=A0ABP9R9P3_9GAMM